jgi:hypothetical protein
MLTFSDDIPRPTRAELESILLSISNINNKIKVFDKEVGLSKAYHQKTGQGGMSPVDGEDFTPRSPNYSRGKAGDDGRRGFKGKGGISGRGSGVKVVSNDKMED